MRTHSIFEGRDVLSSIVPHPIGVPLAIWIPGLTRATHSTSLCFHLTRGALMKVTLGGHLPVSYVEDLKTG